MFLAYHRQTSFWGNLAPLILQAPNPVMYLNTLVGTLVIALTTLTRGMPTTVKFMQMGPSPPGWSYTPPSWPQRRVMIAPGLAAWRDRCRGEQPQRPPSTAVILPRGEIRESFGSRDR